MIEKYVRDFLRSVAAIRDRVDQGTDLPGIYAGTVPISHRGECIVLSVVSVAHNNHLGGESSTCTTMLQVTAYGTNPARAYSLSELVRNRLSGYSGPLGDSDETNAECIVAGSAGAQEEAPADASDKWVHSYTVDYEINFQTPVPTLT